MAIQGNTSLMLFNIDSSHPNYEALKNIEKQVKNGAELTLQLLGYARKGKYEVKPISLNQLVEETGDTFGRAKKDITIHRELSEDLFATEADQGQIEQVLLNLYVNAADAMPAGGDLTLKTMNATHEDMKDKPYDPIPGNYALLSVADTGIGMEKEIQKRIFDPFFTTKEMGRGTGLGLASVYGIIKGHGGYIDVQSEKGHGTTFSIYLPASDQKAYKEIEKDIQITERTGTILLVDDEEMVLDVSAKMLKNLGYTVFRARSGNEAIETYEENKDHIDMIILDMVMPQMGGGETYDRLKEIDPDVKVLLSSGYSIDGQAKDILSRGCDGFIHKPFGMEELVSKTREILLNK
jgi:two-component system cell cycle sensor histidine kinase/response regulator CckA